MTWGGLLTACAGSPSSARSGEPAAAEELAPPTAEAPPPAPAEPEAPPSAPAPAETIPAETLGLAEPPAPGDPLDAVRERLGEGDTAGAAALLHDGLAADLPRFRRAFDDDEALETLRRSDEAPAIRARIAAVEAAYRAAAPEGVPAVLFREGRPPLVRGGLYLPSVRRFLPVGSVMRETVAVLVVPAIERVVVVTARGTGNYAGRPRLGGTLYPFYGETGSIASSGHAECNECAFAALSDRMLSRHGIEGAGRSWAVRTTNDGEAEGDLEWIPVDGHLPHRSLWIRGVPVLRDPYYDPFHEPGNLDRDGIRRDGPLRGWRVDGNRIERDGADAIALGPGHAVYTDFNLVPDADASVVYVLGQRDYPSCSHVIERVDVASGAVARVGVGRGVGVVTVLGDAVYVQEGETTRRVRVGEARDDDTWPEGFGLMSPLGCRARR